ALQCFRAQAEDGELHFIANSRQWPQKVRYKAHLPGGAVYLTDAGFTYSYYSERDMERIHTLRHERGSVADEVVRGHAYSVRFYGCNPSATNEPAQKAAHYYNYFLGSDSTRWAGGMAAY